MFSKSKGTMGSMLSILVFVICCGIMVADFSLWWLPICSLPLVLYFNLGYKGHWESDAVDEAAEEEQSEEPYAKTWPFNELEAVPADSKRQELHNKEVRKERKALERAQENVRIRTAEESEPGFFERAEMDRDLRRERKAIERVQQQAARDRIRDEYRD